MTKIFNVRVSRKDFQEAISIMVSIVIVGIIGYMVSFVFQKYLDVKTQFSTLENEIQLIKQRVQVVQTNHQLGDKQIDEYNQVLSTLIPEQEDFFSIVVALENLSRETGFFITNYTINFNNSKNGKVAITIDGKGDSESFLDFLRTYKFIGKRLITTEKIDYDRGNYSGVKISLNFYSKRVANNSLPIGAALSKKDIELLKEIQGKANIILKSESDNLFLTATEEAELKDDPFLTR